MRRQTFFRRIHAEPDRTLGLLSDLSRDPLWRAECDSAELVDGDAGEQGAKYFERLSWEGLQSDCTVVIAELDDKHIVREILDSRMACIVRCDVEPAPGGDTDLSIDVKLRVGGPLHLVEPFAWNLAARYTERDLDRLEALLAEDAEKD